MANIPLQPRPKIPPISFFEPISVRPEDEMTDIEFLLGVLKKLNQVIIQVNKNTEFIDEYSGKIEEIEAEVALLRTEMETFETDVMADINSRFEALRTELQSMIATALIQANAYTDGRFSILEQEIQDISIGEITLYDPTTGVLSPLQTVIDNLYGSTREGALTATEYDALDLSATAYDAYDISAFEYDKYGKTLLV